MVNVLKGVLIEWYVGSSSLHVHRENIVSDS